MNEQKSCGFAALGMGLVLLPVVLNPVFALFVPPGRILPAFSALLMAAGWLLQMPFSRLAEVRLSPARLPARLGLGGLALLSFSCLLAVLTSAAAALSSPSAPAAWEAASAWVQQLLAGLGHALYFAEFLCFATGERKRKGLLPLPMQPFVATLLLLVFKTVAVVAYASLFTKTASQQFYIVLLMGSGFGMLVGEALLFHYFFSNYRKAVLS